MTSYRFVSFARQGIGARQPAATTFNVIMRAADQDTTAAISLYGPGDVAGLDRRMIVRREPLPGSVSFAPNFLAAIDLRRADLPWMLSAALPDGAGDRQRLMPWLCLAVFDESVPVLPHAAPGALLPVIEPAFAELPLLDEIHAWAHVQLDDPARAPGDVLTASPEQAVARLIAPRKLEPSTRYVACLIPTTEAGRLAGLGLPPQPGDATRQAWLPTSPGRAKLPVYDHWTFQTGPAGDFEAIAARLAPHDLTAGFTPRALDVGSLLAPGVAPRQVGMPAALAPALPRATPSDIPPAWAWPDSSRIPATQKLTSWLAPIVTGAGTPTVGPPCYGDASRPTQGGVRLVPTWLATLNYDARYRAVAGLGARLVQLHQEELVAETHRRTGSLRAANRLIAGAGLAQAIAQRAFTKHLAGLADARLVAVSRPALARLDAGGGKSIAMTTTATTLGAEVLGATFRRVLHARARTPAVTPIIATRAARPYAPPPSPAVTAATLTQAVVDDHVANPTAPFLGVPINPPPTLARPVAPLLASVPAPTPRQAQILAVLAAHPPPAPRIFNFVKPPTLPLAPHASLIRAALSPGASAVGRLAARVVVAGAAASATLPTSVVADEQLPTPVGDLLRALDPRLVISGGGDVPADRVAILEVDPAFVEAILVGANHELVRELLWRGVPIDPQATLLRQFWPLGAQPAGDIKRITEWRRDQPLGAAGATGASAPRTVVVVRSELVRRFPDALVFLAPRAADGGPALDEATNQLPLFRAVTAPDLMYLGFPQDRATLRAGWYVVIQEHPGAPRFGFDAGPTAAADYHGWMDLDWPRVPVVRKHVSLATAPPTPTPAPTTTWAWNAAHMAAITRQRPVRIAIACADILPASPT